MKLYNILSLKHTHPKDLCFTAWRPNEAGYAWFHDMFGTYDESEAKAICGPELRSDSAIAVPVQDVTSHMVDCMYEGKLRRVMPLNSQVLKAIGVDKWEHEIKHPSAIKKYGFELIK